MNKRSTTQPPSTESPKAEDQGSLAANCIRALLDRAALPRHRHSGHISGLLNLSYHQAHRRMTGIAPWSLEELQAVAAHHGETLVDLFREQKSADYETALLIAGPLRVTCRLWPGQPLAQHRPGDLIAIKGGSEWVVMVAGDTPTRQAFTVRRLIIEPKPDRPRRFAILDDDIDVARGLAAGLTRAGLRSYGLFYRSPTRSGTAVRQLRRLRNRLGPGKRHRRGACGEAPQPERHLPHRAADRQGRQQGCR